MEIASVVYGRRLVCDLKAAVAHSLHHGVHMNEPWNRFIDGLPGQVCLFVLKNWDANVHITTAALFD